MVADRFLSFTSAPGGDAAPGIVHPAEREAWAREALAKAERSVDLAALRGYIPDLTESEYAEETARTDPYAHPVSALRRILVETRAYDDLARSWIAEKRPDLAVVYFQGTDTIGHVFAPWAPPRQPSVSAEDFARYSRVPERYFAEVDRLLGEYRKLAARNGSVLMLASDHGFRWNEGRPEKLSSAAAATAGRWHREQGIYLLTGPGIAATSERAAGRVDQVCATLLALLGLPPGKGLAGPPLPGAPAARGTEVDYRAGFRPVTTVSAAPSGEDVEKLRALGYIGGKEPAHAPAGTSSTRTPASFDNEGLLLRQAGRTAEAAAAFRNALALDPRSAAALWNLSDLLHAEGRDPDTSDALLVQALGAGLPEGAEQAAGRAIAYSRAGQADRGLRLLDAAVAARPDDPKLLLLRGRYRLEGRRCAEARDDFERSARLDGSDPLAHASLGLARLCLGDAPGAARALRRSLELNPEQPEIRRALGQLGPG
jgi:Flp pilus assembly protein TadD